MSNSLRLASLGVMIAVLFGSGVALAQETGEALTYTRLAGSGRYRRTCCLR